MLGIETLFVPVLLMMGLAFLSVVVLRHLRNPILSSIAFGLTFGLGVVFAMSSPIHLGNDLIFDVRGLLVGLAVVFSGWAAGLIALVFGLAYRIDIGGAGMMAGCVGLGLAFGIGMLWRGLEPVIRMPDVLKDACFGMMSSFTLLSLFLLPVEMAVAVSAQIGPSLLVANVLGAMTLGFVLRQEARHQQDAAELRRFAEIDPLTETLNRRGTARALARLEPKATQGRALLYIDVDHFKSINDTHGHSAGDAALMAVAARIKSVLREEVLFSRHGGDEFTLFLPDVSEASVARIAHRIRQAINHAPFAFQNQEFPISVSIGAFWSDQANDYDAMLLQADVALLKAKARGRNCVDLGWMPPNPPAGPANWQPASKALH